MIRNIELKKNGLQPLRFLIRFSPGEARESWGFFHGFGRFQRWYQSSRNASFDPKCLLITGAACVVKDGDPCAQNCWPHFYVRTEQSAVLARENQHHGRYVGTMSALVRRGLDCVSTIGGPKFLCDGLYEVFIRLFMEAETYSFGLIIQTPPWAGREWSQELGRKRRRGGGGGGGQVTENRRGEPGTNSKVK